MTVKLLNLRLGFVVLLSLVGTWGCSKEAKLSKHLEAADRHFQQRDFEKAKIEYLNVLQIQNTNAVAFERLGKILFEQGQPLQAYPLLATARRFLPDDIVLRENLVAIQARFPGETNRARFLTEAGELLDRDPTNTTAVLVLADTARTPEELAAFEKRIADLRSRAGNHAIFHVADAELSRKRGDTNACERLLRAGLQLEPASWITHQVFGNFLALMGRFEEAETELRRAKELTPPYSPAWERWARFLVERGRLPEAKAVFDEINSKAPERLASLGARAQIALSERDFETAENLLTRALRQAPNHVETLRTIAQVRLAQNRTADAIRGLEKIVELAPRSAQSHYQLALALIINKDSSRAIDSLERAVQIDPAYTGAGLLLADLQIARGQTPAATKVLQEVIRREPEREQAYLQLIRAQRLGGHHEEAEATAKDARQRFPGSSSAALQLGIVLRQQNKMADARQAFEDASRLTTNNLAALEQLTSLDVQEKEFDGALRRLQGRLNANPAEPVLWQMKAEVHLAQNNYADAEAALRKVLELNPASDFALLSLARVQARTGRQKDAIEQLDQLIQRSPNEFQAWVLLGMIRSDRREYAAARSAYEGALKVKPDSAVVLNNLAFTLAEHLGEVEEGYRIAQQARQRAPQDALVADTLGWIEFRRGKYADAVRLLNEASAKLPANPEVHYHLGMSHYMLAQEAPARDALRKAVDARADFPDKEVARTHLAVLDTDPANVDATVLASLEMRRQQNPKDIVVLSRLAKAYEHTGAISKAQEVLEKGLSLSPEAVPFLLGLADLYANQANDPAKALELARKARDVAPQDPEVAYRLGHLSYLAGDSGWAYSLLAESARALPNRADVKHDLAFTTYSQGRIEEGIKLMESALKSAATDPKLAESGRTFVAMAALAKHPSTTTPDSIAEIQKVLRNQPHHVPALYASGLIAEAQGRNGEARDIYEGLLARFPAFMPATRQLTLLYAGPLDDHAKAFELGVKARQADPRDTVLAAALGKVVLRRDDFRYAVQLLSEASRTQTKDASLYYALGKAQQGLKHGAEARDAFEKALALEPNAPFAADLKERLAAVSSNE